MFNALDALVKFRQTQISVMPDFDINFENSSPVVSYLCNTYCYQHSEVGRSSQSFNEKAQFHSKRDQVQMNMKAESKINSKSLEYSIRFDT